MKIVILSVTAGEGHNSTARAMRDYFTSRGAQAEIVDTYGYFSSTVMQSINKTYLWVSAHARTAWKLGYTLAEKRRTVKELEYTPAQIIQLPIVFDILEYLKNSRPDAVVFTHPFAGLILDVLKREGKIHMPTIGILTDFTFHPYWEDCTHNDYVVIPSSALRFQAYRKGFSDSQLLPLGIPIHPKFAVDTAKEEARAALSLDPAMPTLLLMGGSMGYGNMASSLTALDELDGEIPFQIICVCGNNKKAWEEIHRMQTRRTVLNLGFVDYVDRLMDASDCIVTKPGGLTTSEALAKRLPMIIVNPIPGQESRNMEFLLNCGAAAAVNGMCTMEELVCRLFESENRLNAMRMSIEDLRRPDSTQNVCEFVMEKARNFQHTDEPEKE
jgi:processive 1,2-diacylglycerol beta-glucosyltransferase